MLFPLLLLIAVASCMTPDGPPLSYETVGDSGPGPAAPEYKPPTKEELRQKAAEAAAADKAWREYERRKALRRQQLRQQLLQRCKAAHAAIDRCTPRCKSYQLYKLRREVVATCE